MGKDHPMKLSSQLQNIKAAVFLFSFFVFSFETAQAKKIDVTGDETAVVKAPKTASNGNDLRMKRRMGVGVEGAGPLGVGGVILELNFSAQSGLLAGFGGGTGFQSYTFQYKRVLGGEWLLPYLGAGFARWSSFENSKPIKDTTPSILSDKLMSEDDKAAGRISETLLYPVAGLQYMQLDGDWAGVSAFVELVLLVDVVDFVAAPTGTVGVGYYF